MTEIITAALGIIRVFLGFLILLIIPGLGVTLAYFPDRSDLSVIDRLVLSGVLSIGVAILCGLFADYVLGIETTSGAILILLLGVTALSAGIWRIRIWHSHRILQEVHIDRTQSSDSRRLVRYIFRFVGKCRTRISRLFDERTMRGGKR